MFKILDVEKIEEGRIRLEVETDDASLFALVSLFQSLVEFSVSFRHKSQLAQLIKNRELTRPERMEKVRLENEEMLSLYESYSGGMKERLHKIRDVLKEGGKDWVTLDGIISMLAMARRERKEKEKEKESERERKSA